MSNDLDLLGLEPTATAQDIKSRWRVLARLNHPDHGGDSDAFIKLHEAYKRAMKFASNPIVCPDCQGRRRIYTNHGFATTTLTCKTCKGTGELRL